MQVNVTIDSGSASQLKNISQAFPDIVRKTLVDAAAVLHQASLRKINQLIYSIPETEVLRRDRKTGQVKKKKLWKRSSDLVRAEAAGANYAYLRDFRVVLSNNSPYAWRRHQLKYPAKTRVRTLTGRGKKATYTTIERPDRTAHWREDALQENKQRVADIFENGVQVGINAIR